MYEEVSGFDTNTRTLGNPVLVIVIMCDINGKVFLRLD